MSAASEPPVEGRASRTQQRLVAPERGASGEPPVEVRALRTQQRAVRLRRALTEMAGRQHGVVARRQLLAIGFSRDAIRRLVSSGWLHRVHRGVYHVGHATPTRLGIHLAATAAFGKRTAVSHRPAVILGELLPDRGLPIEVTTASGDAGWHDGVLVHESRRLVAADVTRLHGIPVVRLEWAIVDVAGTGDRAEFDRLFNAVDRKRLVDPLRLAGQLRRGRTGSALVRERLATYTARPPTESELEELFLDVVVRAHEIASPVRQSSPLPRRAQRVDFAWPRERVVVEIDGRAWHAIQAAWGEDHERDLRLRLAGWHPLRYTHRQLTRTTELVVADLRTALRPTCP